MEEKLFIDDINDLRTLSGTLNTNFQELEKQLHVQIEAAEDGLAIRGEKEPVEAAHAILEKMLHLKRTGIAPDAHAVHYLTEKAVEQKLSDVRSFSPNTVCITAKGRPISSKTQGQTRYIEAMRKNEVTFAVGPAGTGKTFLAVAMAVQAFRQQEVERIVLTRPAVEAGEKLGFLPGDLQTKVDPYMRPLYDALFELMGAEQYTKNLEKGVIEVSPLAYMRGRTLDSSFIILDEAQNTTMEQMKMFLTRIGFNSKAVITGDVTQIDLPHDKKSGLKGVRQILKAVEGLSFIDLDQSDVVRNGLVQRIIRAYEAYDKGGRTHGSFT